MDVSVVIPSFNGRQFLAANFPKIIAACLGCEIVIVDDGSKDKTANWLGQTYPKIKCLNNTTNKGFAFSVNRGVRAATRKMVLILNNDVAPEPGFLEPLVRILAKDERIFSVGSKEIAKFPDGKEIISGKSWLKIDQGLPVHGRCADQAEGETAWTQGGSMLVRKDLFLKMGGFDPLFAPGYWEDIDLGWRAQAAGYRNYFCPDSVVHHQHGTTFNRIFSEETITTLSYRNAFLFCWKNLRKRQLVEHLIWLPYNLAVKGYQTKGRYIRAFWCALRALIVGKKEESSSC